MSSDEEMEEVQSYPPPEPDRQPSLFHSLWNYLPSAGRPVEPGLTDNQVKMLLNKHFLATEFIDVFRVVQDKSSPPGALHHNLLFIKRLTPGNSNFRCEATPTDNSVCPSEMTVSL